MKRGATCLVVVWLVFFLAACAREQSNVIAFQWDKEDAVLNGRLEAYMKAEEAKNKPGREQALKYDLNRAALSLDKPLQDRLNAIRFEIKKVKPGMTRQDLFRAFEMEGYSAPHN